MATSITYKFQCKCCGGEFRKLALRGRHRLYCDECIPIKLRAQISASKKARYAVKVGRLPHPETLACVDCGMPAKHYEHRDYLKPLDVVATCISCNLKRGAANDMDVAVDARREYEARPKAERRAAGYCRLPKQSYPRGMTQREHQSLVLAIQTPQRTYKAIARDLGISHRTIEIHLRRAYHKLGVSQRREAIAIGVPT